jgi:hypothetical protein
MFGAVRIGAGNRVGVGLGVRHHLKPATIAEHGFRADRDLLPPHGGGHAGNCGYHLTFGALKALHRYFRTVRCCGGYSAKCPSRSSLWALAIQQSAAPVWLKADR